MNFRCLESGFKKASAYGLIILVSLSSIFVGCAIQQPAKDKGMSLIASGDGNDFSSRRFIYGILIKNGINCYIEGSLTFGVFVEKDKAADAIRILKETKPVINHIVRVVEK